MPTTPLTASRVPDLTYAADIPQIVSQTAVDLEDNTTPRFATPTARDTAYANWVTAGGAMESGLRCTVAGSPQIYTSGAWKPESRIESGRRNYGTFASGAVPVNANSSYQDATNLIEVTNLMAGDLIHLEFSAFIKIDGTTEQAIDTGVVISGATSVNNDFAIETWPSSPSGAARVYRKWVQAQATQNTAAFKTYLNAGGGSPRLLLAWSAALIRIGR